jgi:hypothetical protein
MNKQKTIQTEKPLAWAKGALLSQICHQSYFNFVTAVVISAASSLGFLIR